MTPPAHLPMHLRPALRHALSSLLVVMACVVVHAPMAIAEEPPETARPPVAPAKDAAGEAEATAQREPARTEAAALETIGRQLLSENASERADAREALLHLLANSEEPGQVLAEAMRSTRTWADASERLIQRWIGVALGDDRESGATDDAGAKARRQAIRFLHAAGPEAILRLVNAQRDRLLGLREEARAFEATDPTSSRAKRADLEVKDQPPTTTQPRPTTGTPGHSRPGGSRPEPAAAGGARIGPAWTSAEEGARASAQDDAERAAESTGTAHAPDPGAPATRMPGDETPRAETPDVGSVPATAQQAVAPRSIQAYDISLLHRARIEASRLRVFLSREADTEQVTLAGGKAIVMASEVGHQRLRAALEAWRQRLRDAWARQVTAKAPAPDGNAAQEPPEAADPRAPRTESEPQAGTEPAAAPVAQKAEAMPPPGARIEPATQTAEAEQGPNDPRANQNELADDKPTGADKQADEGRVPPVQQAAPAPPGKAVQAPGDDGPRWRISPLIVRVPKRPDSGVVEPQRRLNGKPASGVVAPLFPDAEAGVHTLVGTLDDAQRWSKLAEVFADAETHRPGAVKVAAARTGNQFIGRRRNYRRDVERKKDGGYAVVEGVILEGLHLGFRIQQAAAGKILLETQARRIEAKGPWQTRRIRVKGSTQTLELDLPEKNVARGTATATLPASGGGVAILFRDLERAKEHYVVLVLTIKRLP